MSINPFNNTRLQLFTSQGEKAKDRVTISVSARKIKVSPQKTPELNGLEKKYYVLYQTKDAKGHECWFRINKNSLEKRLGVSKEELHINKKGIAQNLSHIVGEKEKLINDWSRIFSKISVKAKSDARKIISEMAAQGIPTGSYKLGIFWDMGTDNPSVFQLDGVCRMSLEELKQYKPGEILLIPLHYRPYQREYITAKDDGQKTYDFLNTEESPLVIVPFDQHSLKSFQKTGKIPEDIAEKLKNGGK